MTPSAEAASQTFNQVRFQRMACGDVPGFFELADEFFTDVKVRLSQWPDMRQAGEFPRLLEEFHRCKGGAAMFGFERLFSLLGSWESDSGIGQGQFDLERFAEELEAAETAVTGFRESSNV